MTLNALNEDEFLLANRNFYEPLWRDARLVEPEHFNTWSLVRPLVAKATCCLEVAPGLRPRLPVDITTLVDISMNALTKLADRGGKTVMASIGVLPFGDGTFDLLSAFDIIEHVDNDQRAMAELARVATIGATLLLSAPLHPEMWSPFDDIVGHRRRYEPKQIQSLLQHHGFSIERSAVFGMIPRFPLLQNLSMWFLKHRRERAMRWYNRVMPYTMRLQSPLQFHEGMINTDGVDEILFVCKRVSLSSTL